ncbi:MAG: polymerase epsilon subunit [Pseudomonadota bacterium]|jgi:DNA polymerase-3 subunit epsilon
MRQIVLDTETTGLDHQQGHRIIEIGCVELDNRRLTGRHFHRYLNPDREIEEAAIDVHGITNEFLADKPRFEQIAGDFLDFVRDAELIIHNAPFDVGFINSELTRLQSGHPALEACCTIVDTLALARKKHPGQRNNLDALCKRYAVDNSQRQLHGALLDAEILADVYLAMTGGQTRLWLGMEETVVEARSSAPRHLDTHRKPLKVISASPAEQEAHERRLASIDKASKNRCIWLQLEGGGSH